MRIRREIWLFLTFLVVIAVVLKAAEIFQSTVVESDASNFVLEDLATKYPDADIEIMLITQKYNDKDEPYFEVKTKVTTRPNSPCPERSHIFYNYPVQNFVPQPTEIITSDCNVCNEPICTIAFEEEAVIASHMLPGAEAVHSYLMLYPDAVPSVTEQTGGWIVQWDSHPAPSYYTVTLLTNGTVKKVVSSGKVSPQ